jgi:hypothetical protein
MNNESNTAWIISCKQQESGWLVNGNMSVPNDPANRHCGNILEWIAEGNTPAPQYTDEEIAANAQAQINATSEAYLAATDWYVTRNSETGAAIPENITAARAEARAAIVEGT